MEGLSLDNPVPVVATVGAVGVVAVLVWKFSTKSSSDSKSKDQAAVKTKKAKKNKTEKAAPPPPAPETPAEEPKKKKNRSSKNKGKKEEVPEPAPAAKPAPKEPAPVVETPAPVDDASFQEVGKKKKKGKAAAAQPAEPAVAPTPAPPKDDGFSVVGKKKGKKADNTAAQAAPAPKAPEPQAAKPAAKPAEDEWETVPSKKGSSKKTAAKAAAEPSPTEESAPAAPKKAMDVIDLGTDLPAVMGKGGQVIKSIQQETGAKLDIEKGGTICKVSGTPEETAAAMGLIKEIIDAEATSRANQRSDKLNVGDKAPAVIGKGGATIKKISTESGAKVEVDCDTGTVAVSGTAEQVAAAKKMIHVAIHGEAQETIELGKNGRFLVIGKEGATVKKLQLETGAKFDIVKDKSILKISGSKEAVEMAGNMVRKLLDDNNFVITQLLPDSKIGAVVGKGGTTIRQIQDSTGARLETEKDEDLQSVLLKIIGTKEQVAAAKEQVDKCLSGEVQLKSGEICKTVELGLATGAVIGAQGKNVVEMEKETGAKIDVLRGTSTCRIYGQEANVKKAHAKIEEIVAQANAKQAERDAKAATAQKAVVEEKSNGWDVPTGNDDADDAW